MRKAASLIVVILLVLVMVPNESAEGAQYALKLQGYAYPSYDGNARWFDGEMFYGNITAIEINDLDVTPRGADDAINDQFGGTYGEIDFFQWDATPVEGRPWEWYTAPDEKGENIIYVAEYQHFDEENKEYVNYTWATNWHAWSESTPEEMEEHNVRYEPMPPPVLNPYTEENVGATWINISIPHFKYTDYNAITGEPNRMGTYDLFQSYAVFIRMEGKEEWEYLGNSQDDPKNPPTHEPLPANSNMDPREINTGSQYFLATDLYPDTGYEFKIRVNFRTRDAPNLGPVWGYGGGLGDKEEQLLNQDADGGSITPFASRGGAGVIPTGSADPPSEPRNLEAFTGINHVYLEWEEPLDDGGAPISSYHIYRNTTVGDFVYHDTVDASTLSYSDSAVVNGVEYKYYVTAQNMVGESPPSNQASAVPIGVASEPRNLEAHGELDHIELEWDPPSTDGGSTITQYWIYRDDSYYDYVDAPNTSYTDYTVDSGVEYAYYVRARNSVGLGPESDHAYAASFTTYDITLSSSGPSNGWNFISSLLIPDDTDIETILNDPTYGISDSYDRVMYYDSMDGSWKSYVPGRASHFNMLTEWDETMGIWIRMTDNVTLTIKGAEPVNTTIVLYPGWNMVGYPSSITGNNGLPTEVTIIGRFDASEEYNIAYVYSTGDHEFEPGEAYWIYNDEEYSVDWIVEY